MSDDRDTCVYQPREFSKPTLERLTEIVRDELYSIQVLFNDACLRPILVQQLPDPLPEIVDSMGSLDCCGIIVRDCTEITGGGVWEYSDFQLTQLASRQLTGGGGREFMTIRDSTFEARTDERIVVVEDNYLVQVGEAYTVELVDNALVTTVASSVTNAGNSPGDLRLGIHGIDYPTGLYHSSDGNFGFSEVGSAGSHLRLLAPFEEVTASWFFGEANCNPEWSGLVWFRGGAFYHGVRRTGNSCVNFNRVMKFTGLVAGAERLLPTASILNVDDGSSNFTMYVSPTGSDVWVCTGDDTWALSRYDSNLVLQESFNVSYVKRVASVGFKGFAVLGDFLFELQGPIVALWRLSTSEKLAEYGLPLGSTARHSNILLPHPDGTLYLQTRLNGGTNISSTVYALQYAEATYSEPVTGTIGWRCMELQTVGGSQSRITIQNPAAQGGDPIFDLREVTQTEGGTPQAMTVDAWGRVVANRPLVAGDIEPFIPESSPGVLPMTTGEVPPVLVYGPDGSLIYFEVS